MMVPAGGWKTIHLSQYGGNDLITGRKSESPPCHGQGLNESD
jgi:hypothetical protein